MDIEVDPKKTDAFIYCPRPLTLPKFIAFFV